MYIVRLSCLVKLNNQWEVDRKMRLIIIIPYFWLWSRVAQLHAYSFIYFWSSFLNIIHHIQLFFLPHCVFKNRLNRKFSFNISHTFFFSFGLWLKVFCFPLIPFKHFHYWLSISLFFPFFPKQYLKSLSLPFHQPTFLIHTLV